MSKAEREAFGKYLIKLFDRYWGASIPFALSWCFALGQLIINLTPANPEDVSWPWFWGLLLGPIAVALVVLAALLLVKGANRLILSLRGIKDDTPRK